MSSTTADPVVGNAIVHVLYPTNVPGTSTPNTFNLDYYLAKHIPLVKAKWLPVGLKSVAVATLEPSTGYAIECVLVWETAEAWDACGGDPELKADVKNYSEIAPISWVAKVVG